MDFLSRRVGGMVVDAAKRNVTTNSYLRLKVVLDGKPAVVEIAL
jgi:hypothetical protein